jgi:hypothetical protein
MTRLIHRKTTPGVRDGKVRRKNNWRRSPDYDVTLQPRVFIDRQRAGRGYRHLLLKRDVERFVGLLPDWDELSRGLHAIVLAPGCPHLLGYYHGRCVALCAWERQVQRVWDADFAEDHWRVLYRLGVPRTRLAGNRVLCEFTEATARAFQLLHILLHELGHHHDRMSTRAGRESCRGEDFAEQYALRYADRICERYFAEFGW